MCLTWIFGPNFNNKEHILTGFSEKWLYYLWDAIIWRYVLQIITILLITTRNLKLQNLEYDGRYHRPNYNALHPLMLSRFIQNKIILLKLLLKYLYYCLWKKKHCVRLRALDLVINEWIAILFSYIKIVCYICFTHSLKFVTLKLRHPLYKFIQLLTTNAIYNIYNTDMSYNR